MKPETRDALAGRRTATGTFVQERLRAGHSVTESYPPMRRSPPPSSSGRRGNRSADPIPLRPEHSKRPDERTH